MLHMWQASHQGSFFLVKLNLHPLFRYRYLNLLGLKPFDNNKITPCFLQKTEMHTKSLVTVSPAYFLERFYNVFLIHREVF